MTTYTCFCRETNGEGTTWIEAVEAETAALAIDVAESKCASDWSDDVENVECIGIIEGDAKVLFWED